MAENPGKAVTSQPAPSNQYEEIRSSRQEKNITIRHDEKYQTNNGPSTNPVVSRVWSEHGYCSGPKLQENIKEIFSYFYKKSRNISVVFRHHPGYPDFVTQRDQEYIRHSNRFLSEACAELNIRCWDNVLPRNIFLIGAEGIYLTPLGALFQILDLQNKITSQFNENFGDVPRVFDYITSLGFFHTTGSQVSPTIIVPDALRNLKPRLVGPILSHPRILYIADLQIWPMVDRMKLLRFHPSLGVQTICIPLFVLNNCIHSAVFDSIFSVYNIDFSNVKLVIIQVGLSQISLLKRQVTDAHRKVLSSTIREVQCIK